MNGVERMRGPGCVPWKCKKDNGKCNLIQKHPKFLFYKRVDKSHYWVLTNTNLHPSVCLLKYVYESATSSLCGQKEVIARSFDFWLEETFGL